MNSNQWIYNKYAHGCGKVLLPVKGRASSQKRSTFPFLLLGILVLSAVLISLFTFQHLDITSSSKKKKESGSPQRIIMDILGTSSEAPQAPAKPMPKKQPRQKPSVMKDKMAKTAPAETVKNKRAEIPKRHLPSSDTEATKLKLPRTKPAPEKAKSIPERESYKQPPLQTGTLEITPEASAPRPRELSGEIKNTRPGRDAQGRFNPQDVLNTDSSAISRPKASPESNTALNRISSVDSGIVDTGQSDISSSTATSLRGKPETNAVGIERRTEPRRESPVQTGTLSTGNNVARNTQVSFSQAAAKSISRRKNDTEALASTSQLPVGNAPPARQSAPQQSEGISNLRAASSGQPKHKDFVLNEEEDFSTTPLGKAGNTGKEQISKPKNQPRSISEINKLLRSSAALNLGELPICPDLARQDRLQDEIVRTLRPYRDRVNNFCTDKTGTYGFWNIRSGTTLAVKYAPADGNQPGNRCNVLKQAIKCLQKQKR